MRRLFVLLLGLVTALGLFTVSATTRPAAAVATAVTAAGPADQAGTYRTVPQLRVLDSRSGVGGPARALAPGEIRTLQVAGRGSLPATGLAAVAVNVGVLTPARSGSITVFPGGTGWTGVGSISFRAGVTVQSSLTAKLGANGTLAVRNNTGSALQLIADVAGYYLAGTPTAAGAFGALSLARVLDTRSGIGGPATAVAPGQTRRVTISGHGGVPATGVAAVAVNVGVLAPARTGSVAVFAGDTTWNGTGSISFSAGVTVQSSLTAKLGADGTLALRNNTGVSLQLIADVAGYYLAGPPTVTGGYQPVTATRALDTRNPDWGALRPGDIAEILLAPLFGPDSLLVVPGLGVAAVSVNIGVLAPEVSGSVSVFAGNTAWNRTGSISFPAGVTVQSSLTATLGVAGTLQIRNNTTSFLNIIVDVAGYYLGRQAPAGLGVAENPDPGHGMVTSVSCATANWCVAVEQSGYALVYDGQWSPARRVFTATTVLNSVSCPTTAFCVAVGATASGGVAYTFDGTSWSAPVLLGTQPSAVSCVSTTFCVAVDNSGGTRSYDGTSWSARTVVAGAPSLRSVSCASPTFCAALDYSANAAMFNGTSWSMVPASTGTALGRRPVSCVSQTFCVAVGPAGGSTVYDGTSWSAAAGIDAGRVLEDVSCATTSFCMAVDHDGRAMSFDGHSWTAPAAIGAGMVLLGRISCPSAGACVVLTRDHVADAYRYNGVSWGSPVYLDSVHATVVGVSCTSADFCMLLDQWGAARSYTASGWGAWAEADPGTPVWAISCASPAFCVAVDGVGRAVVYNGSSWGQPVTVDGTDRLTSVSCASSTSCVAVDGQGRAVSYDAGVWSSPVQIDSYPLVKVSCASAQFCVAADALGRAVTRTGMSWSAPVATNLDSATALSCPTPSFCLMTTTQVPTNSTAITSRFDGTTWSSVPTNPHQRMAVLSCSAAAVCAGAGTDLLAFGFDGTSWSAGMPLDYRMNPPGDISCASDGFCMLAGSHGWVTRLTA
jgi:hypothetical protein